MRKSQPGTDQQTKHRDSESVVLVQGGWTKRHGKMENKQTEARWERVKGARDKCADAIRVQTVTMGGF